MIKANKENYAKKNKIDNKTVILRNNSTRVKLKTK